MRTVSKLLHTQIIRTDVLCFYFIWNNQYLGIQISNWDWIWNTVLVEGTFEINCDMQFMEETREVICGESGNGIWRNYKKTGKDLRRNSAKNYLRETWCGSNWRGNTSRYWYWVLGREATEKNCKVMEKNWECRKWESYI